MLITKNVKIKINNRYVKYYKNLGYKNIKGGDEITIPTKHLSVSSNAKVEISCDKCGAIKNENYNAYQRYTNNQTKKYYCVICNNVKRKITNNKKYGCDNVFQNEEIKKKRKNTMIKKYGNEHALNITEFKEKTKKTNLEKFGTEYASQNENIKQKIEDTFLRNYGVKTSLLNPDTIEKIKKTNIKLYGADNVFKLRKYKEEKMLEKYGVESPFKIKGMQKKIKENNIKKYGYECPMKNEKIKEKAKQERLKNGSYLTEDQRTEYRNYWLKVKRETNKHKKELFEKWNGLDYYDDEYIKNNFLLQSGNKNYPTIDHKTSVSYGFKNNISPKVIGNINNLCITKRTINSSKNSKNEKNYLSSG